MKLIPPLIAMAVIMLSGFIAWCCDQKLGITSPVLFWAIGSIGGVASVILMIEYTIRRL